MFNIVPFYSLGSHNTFYQIWVKTHMIDTMAIELCILELEKTSVFHQSTYFVGNQSQLSSPASDNTAKGSPMAETLVSCEQPHGLVTGRSCRKKNGRGHCV